MKRRILSLFFACVLLCALFPAPARADGSTPPAIPTAGNKWDGTTITAPSLSNIVQKDGVNYIKITKCAELAYIAQTGGEWLSRNYLLANDLILNDVEIKWDADGNLLTDPAALHQWTPIGNDAATFSGKFDGGGHTISGLYINKDNGSYSGLFGFGGGIAKLAVVNSYVKNVSRSSYYVGGIAGRYYSGFSIVDCVFSGAVVSNGQNGNYAGGITGCGDAQNCINYGTIIGQERVGGITGFGRAQNCINYGSITGTNNVGGVCGGDGPVNLSANHGSVTGESSVGSIAGRSGTVENCYNTAAVTGTSNVGGIVGNDGSYIENCYNIGSVNCTVNGNNAGAVIGSDAPLWNTSNTITGCYYLKSDTVNKDLYGCGGVTSAGNEPAGFYAKSAETLKAQSTFGGWDFTDVWRIDASKNDGYPFLAMESSLPGASASSPANRSNITDADVTLSDASYVYDGTAKTPSVAVKVGDYTLSADTDYTVTMPNGRVNAGDYTVTVAGKGDYGGTAAKTFTITPRPLTITGATAVSRPYAPDSKAVEIASVSFGDYTLAKDVDYTASGMMDYATAGDTQPVTVKVTLKNGNYSVDPDTYATTVTISKIDYAGSKTASGSVKAGMTCSIPLPVASGSTATITNTVDDHSIAAGVSIVDGSLHFTAKNDAAFGKSATVTVHVSGTNYNDYDATVTVAITDKTAQSISFAQDSVRKIYGDADFTAAVSGAQTSVSYASGTPAVASVDAAGKVHIVGAGETVITATAAETSEYASATARYTLTVARKAVTVKANDLFKAKGASDPKPTATVTGLLGTDTVQYTFSRRAGEVEGDYDITPSGAAEQGNYAVTYVKGKLTIGSATALTGTVTISGTAKVGQTLTAAVSGSNNTGVLSYQWKANGTTISGATGNTFKLTAAEQGKTITCEVKSTVQTGSITSAATAAVAAADSSTTTAIWLNYTWLDLYVGDSGYLYATVTPSTDSVRWYSSDSSVVSVSSSGRYYANDWGSALITATAVGSGKSASCRIYVTDRYYNNDRRNTDKTIYEPITNPAAQKSGDSANKLPVETSVNTVAKTDGSKQTVINQPDGTSSVLITDGIGLVKSASVTYSSDAVNSASWSNGLLNFPGKVLPANNADSAPALRIVLPQSSQRVRVKVPVSYITPGTVAVVENAFGPDQVLHSSTVQNDGVEFYLTGSSVVKIVDMTKDFYDISGNEWYAKSVDWASSHGVMNGVSEHAFDPNATMNRAMMTQIVYNYAGANADGVTGRFSDVNKNSWYGKSVTWAANNGIARASGDSFGAENDLTREDMVDMLYSYAKSKGYNTYQAGNTFSFADNADISDWARPAMSWAVGSGLIQGTQNGTRAVVLDPQGTATRAQLSAIMMRFNNMYEN